jgi:hypothetical protein
MQGPSSKQPEITPEQMKQLIPEDIKHLRELTLKLLSNKAGKEWLEQMKIYYMLKNPVASPEYPAAYCRFREGQNSLLRAIEMFAKEENEFNRYMAAQLLGSKEK